MTSVQQTAGHDAHTVAAGRHPIVPGEVVTARVNGCAVAAQLDHRRWVTDGSSGPGYEPVAVEVLAPIRLSFEDVTAILFDSPYAGRQLDDPGAVRELVADLVLGLGSLGIEEMRETVSTADRLGPDAAAWLAYCRRRAAAVFGVPDPRRSGEVA